MKRANFTSSAAGTLAGFHFPARLLLVVAGSTAGVADADWNPGDPHKMHFPQLPDLNPTGLDVQAGPRVVPSLPFPVTETFLADDFLCTGTGPITNIHTWGSFNQDIVIGAQPPRISLVIYADVPAGPGNPFSHPGQVLWNSYTTPLPRVYATAQEGFYDPSVNQVVGSDMRVLQYNFTIPTASAFVQTAGTIYWLGFHYSFDLDQNDVVNLADLNILAKNEPAAYGWKTSLDHFNDDAVWTTVNTFATSGHVVPGVTANWRELIYPTGHPLAGQSMDLAFVISTIPEPGYLSFVGLTVLPLLRRRA